MIEVFYANFLLSYKNKKKMGRMYYGGKNESCELSIILWRFGCTTPRNNGQSREAIKLLLSLYLQRTHCNREYTYWERILECCWRNQAWINSTLSDWSWFDQAELDYQFVHGLMIFLFFFLIDRSLKRIVQTKNEDSSAFCTIVR